jgi:Asp-tRNA(Asn)/Glu-tRNA(Gln) amidotransferase A subunit family amidase
MSEIADLTATAAAARIRAGKLDAITLMEACLERIAAREPTVRAFAAFDADQARAAARAARPGVLHGLPIGVKDVLDTADYASEYGSEIWAGHRPRADAAAVAWARAAGGVLAGKTVTTEFATRRPGPTTNPANPAHTPGGSSSGSAAGVAAGMFPLAFGTQTSGSVIRPAAFCGVVGYKPTFGTIARQGMKVMAENLDTIGVMARSVADCALFAGAVAAIDLGDPEAKLDAAPRIGLCRSPAWAAAAPETQALIEHAAITLTRAGARLAMQELPPEYAALVDAHAVLMNAESAASMGWELLNARDRISDGLRERLDWGLAQGPQALADARARFASLQAGFPAAMGECDILLTPSAPGEAPAGLGWTGDPAFNAIWTSLHVPCVTVPAGLGPNGLPLGLQIVGRQGDDRRVLAWAQWVSAAIQK